jgi:tetratricopeptide (TPR) repeat protein
VLHFAKGSALGSLKRYDEAKDAYLAAISLDADYFDAYNNLGSLYLDQTAPLVDQMNNLGLSQADQKKYNALKKQRNNLYKLAKPYLEEAVRIDNTAIQVLNALKDVCYQTDDIDCWKKTNDCIKELTK